MTDMRQWMMAAEEMVEEASSLASTRKFRRWFAGSKVVDTDGQPLVCYHGSSGTFDAFRPLSHFGTSEAANTRLNDRAETGTVISVYLRITQPLRFRDSGRGSEFLIDDVIASTPDDFWEDMSSDELDRLQDDDGPWAQQFFIEYLSGFGYDGLVYENKIEHRLSTSWVIFDPKQIWSLSSTQPGRL